MSKELSFEVFSELFNALARESLGSKGLVRTKFDSLKEDNVLVPDCDEYGYTVGFGDGLKTVWDVVCAYCFGEDDSGS